MIMHLPIAPSTSVIPDGSVAERSERSGTQGPGKRKIEASLLWRRTLRVPALHSAALRFGRDDGLRIPSEKISMNRPHG